MINELIHNFLGDDDLFRYLAFRLHIVSIMHYHRWSERQHMKENRPHTSPFSISCYNLSSSRWRRSANCLLIISSWFLYSSSRPFAAWVSSLRRWFSYCSWSFLEFRLRMRWVDIFKDAVSVMFKGSDCVKVQGFRKFLSHVLLSDCKIAKNKIIQIIQKNIGIVVSHYTQSLHSLNTLIWTIFNVWVLLWWSGNTVHHFLWVW
jgi:hypothetical protein